MRILFLVISILFLIQSSAQGFDQNGYQNLLNELIFEFKLQKIIKSIEDGKISQTKLDIIYYILKNTNEIYIHQLRGQYQNKVYISPDGHSEGVYDEDGKLVKDGINDGSYNYYHPEKEPLRHFSADIHPWILWGNSRQDPTTIEERIFSYVSDLEGGLRRAHFSRNNIAKQEYSEFGQKETLAFFLKVIEIGKAQLLFELFDKDELMKDVILAVLDNIHEGFISLYKEKA